MAINIKAIMKYIDSIGEESALDKIHNYDVSGMSAEDLFGEAAVKELELEIKQESKSRSEVFS